jgi:hypothetical protein
MPDYFFGIFDSPVIKNQKVENLMGYLLVTIEGSIT